MTEIGNNPNDEFTYLYQIDDIMNDLKPMYNILIEFNTSKLSWSSISFNNLDINAINKAIKIYMKQIKDLNYLDQKYHIFIIKLKILLIVLKYLYH